MTGVLCTTDLCSGVPDDPQKVIDATLPFPHGSFPDLLPNATADDYGFMATVVGYLKGGLVAYTTPEHPGILSIAFDPFHQRVSRAKVQSLMLDLAVMGETRNLFQDTLMDVSKLYVPEMALERLKGQMQSDHTIHMANQVLRHYEAEVVASGGRTAADEVRWRLGF